MNMAWVWLLVAAVFEVTWAVGIKFTEGFTRLSPSILVIVTAFGSFYFLALATRVLPIGTSYAVWTGIGAVFTVTIGMIFLNEPVKLVRIGCIALIIIGIVGLKVSTS